MKKRWIYLAILAIISGIYLGAVSGSHSITIRIIVGTVMGLLVAWLASGFIK